METASLVLVGSGIKFLSHLTTEAKTYIEQSDIVLHLVNEPAMKDWIERSNANSKSLDFLYTQYPLRFQCYRAITESILENVRKGQHVCVVLYGHPTVFAQPGLEAVRRAKEEGFYAKVLPGISAEDCLFADLLINPGSCGCLSFEATDFLIHRRQIDNSSHLILWQVGAIGVLDHSTEENHKNGIKVLCDYLQSRYSSNHEVILYEAAQYPHFEPSIVKLTLADLPSATLSRITTLYIPPAQKKPCDKSMLRALGINEADLEPSSI